MHKICLLIIHTYLILYLPCCFSDSHASAYKLLHDSITYPDTEQCGCCDYIKNQNNQNYFFWLKKAFEDNNQKLLFLLLHHPYQRRSLENTCTGFDPFLSIVDRQILTFNSLEYELLKPSHTALAKKVLRLWTSDTKDNPFLEQWCLLLDIWRFQVHLLKSLELIPFGQDTTTPFLKSTKDQQHQWTFWLRCYWIFLNSHDNHLYNVVEKFFSKNKNLWPFEEEYTTVLVNMFAQDMNKLSRKIKKSIKKHYKFIFNAEPQTSYHKLIFRGQTQSLFYSERLINAYVALHLYD